MVNYKISELTEVTELTSEAYIPVIDKVGGINTSLKINKANAAGQLGSLPAGGTTGQALTKASDDDYDTDWTTVSGGGGSTSYDAIVAISGGDYTTVGAALAAGKHNIFVREGSFTETYWDISGKSVNITCASAATIITFSNTDVHGGEYILLSTTSNLRITGGTFAITLNSTNTICVDGDIDNTDQFIWINSTIGLSGDDVAGRIFTNLTLISFGNNGWYNCVFDFQNSANTNPIFMADARSNFVNCTFANGKAVLGGNIGTIYRDCTSDGLVGIGFDGGEYINCELVDSSVLTVYDNAGLTTGTAIIYNAINSRFAYTSATAGATLFSIYGSVNSAFNFDMSGNLELLEYANLDNEGHVNSRFNTDGTISIRGSLSQCHVETGGVSEDITLSASGARITGCLFQTNGGDFHVNATSDYAVINGNYFYALGTFIIDAGCTSAVIGVNSLIGTITDNGTTTIRGMIAVVDDTSPDLGGELDAGAHSIGFTLQAATGDGATTIDWKLGNKFKFTFSGNNETFTFTSPTNPCAIQIIMVQDGTGSRTATRPATVKRPGGTAPTLTTDANAVDIISFIYDGTNYYATSSLDFS